MELKIQTYTKDRIPDVLNFERRLRKEEDFWGWEVDQAYVSAVERSFDDKSFNDAISLLAYDGEEVVGRIDASLIASRFDGSKKAYLDWICVIKSSRHQGVAQRLLALIFVYMDVSRVANIQKNTMMEEMNCGRLMKCQFLALSKRG